MNGNDITTDGFAPKARDVMMAFALLTRLPLPYPAFDDSDTRPAAHAAWAYPIVGVVVGLITAMTAFVMTGIGLPAVIAALVAVLVSVFVTGAMHEDGLADCADGFWGGWTIQRRLEIMKDSHIGTYGVIALIISLCLRWLAIAELIAAGAPFAALVVVAAVSRGSMAWVMATLPNARQTGLSQQTGTPPKRTAYLGIVIAGLCALVLLPGSFVWIVIVALGFTIGMRLLAKSKVGGQTGDILGATQQVVEICTLLTCVSLL